MPEEAAAATFADLFAAEAVTGTAATATAAGTAAGIGAATSGLLEKAGTSLVTGLGSAVATSLLAPKPRVPTLAPVTPMPDPLAQQEAKQRSMIEQMARRGRASTVLTNPADSAGKLGD